MTAVAFAFFDLDRVLRFLFQRLRGYFNLSKFDRRWIFVSGMSIHDDMRVSSQVRLVLIDSRTASS